MRTNPKNCQRTSAHNILDRSPGLVSRRARAGELLVQPRMSSSVSIVPSGVAAVADVTAEVQSKFN